MVVLPRYRGVLTILTVFLKQTWRKVVKNVRCPSPQLEDHAHNEDPGFCEDPDIFVEFDDGIYYQASVDGSEVAITADYPGLYPFIKVSVRKPSSQRVSLVCTSPITLNRVT